MPRGVYPRKVLPLAVRLQRGLVRQPNGCLEWQGCRMPSGHGQINANGKARLTHRVAFELHNGTFDLQLEVCHRCDNPPCCDPAHLFLGTQADNVADCFQKNRTAHGRMLPQAKLTPVDVLRIRKLHAGGQAAAALAEQFDVGKEAVRRLLSGQTWRRVV